MASFRYKQFAEDNVSNLLFTGSEFEGEYNNLKAMNLN